MQTVFSSSVMSASSSGADISVTDGLFVIHLTADERLLVILAAVAFLLFVLITVICIVGEICPLHRCLYKKNNRPNKQYETLSISRRPNAAKNQSAVADSSTLSSKSNRETNYSSMSDSGFHSPSPTAAANKNTKASTWSEDALDSSRKAMLSFSLQYQTSIERQIGKLIINVLEGYHLPSREYANTCDPFVRVTLYKEKRTIRGTKCIVLAEFLTRTQRHSISPQFRQAFSAEISRHELKEVVVKLVAYDEDKYGSPTELGFINQPVRLLKKILNSDTAQLVKKDLELTAKTYGEILVGLSYLPTAQRLTIALTRANALVVSRVTETPANFCPYVRAFLLSGSGRLIKKKKTGARAADSCPVFDETIVFDVAHQQMEAATLLICVFHKPTEAQHSSDNGGRLSEISEQRSTVARKELCVGKVSVGKHVQRDSAVAHWITMLQNPRKTVSQWHCLK